MNEEMVECRHRNRREKAWRIPGKMNRSQNCLQEGVLTRRKGESRGQRDGLVNLKDLILKPDIIYSPMVPNLAGRQCRHRSFSKMQIQRLHLKPTKQDEAGANALLTCIWDPVPQVVVHLHWKPSLLNIYLVEMG